MYKFLENIVDLEKNLMQDVIAHEGKDREMANWYAQDRNDVIAAKELYHADKITDLKAHVEDLDTFIRDAIVMAFAADLGGDWVADNLGWDVR